MAATAAAAVARLLVLASSLVFLAREGSAVEHRLNEAPLACQTDTIAGEVAAEVDGQPETWYLAMSGGVRPGTFEISGDNFSFTHSTPRMNFASRCTSGVQPDMYRHFSLLNASVAFDLNINGAGCGCNVAMYFVAMPAYNSSNVPDPTRCGDYYCDANQVCGIFCPEFDTMEANRYAYQVTPHACDTPQGNYYPHCDGSGCGLNSYRNNPTGFGPGPAYTIDTTRTFTSTTTFVADSQSQLVEVHTQLSQDGRVFQMVNNGATCRTQGYLAQLSAALQQGMVIAISYWGDQGSSMSWLDSPPCNLTQNCNGTGVSFAAFKITHF